MSSFDQKIFLMLQGPHGPFFDELAGRLRAGGHGTLRIGFNAGDRYFWTGDHFEVFDASLWQWREYLTDFISRRGVTDLVVYDDTRARHRNAMQVARHLGVRLHVFEEGYLRPYWATYEREGANGYSPLMDFTVEDMREALETWPKNVAETPATWGEIREHIFYGAVYHAKVLMQRKGFAPYVSHRARSIQSELESNVKHMLSRPFKAVRRYRDQKRIERGSFVYSLALLQLAHDASIQHHSSFRDMISFIRLCLQDFEKGAPKHHHLVFKAHPLEDYFLPLAEYTFARAEQLGIRDRVHFVEGGKLADLLNAAHSVVTVNSTAAQQALWRGLPVKALGRSVYQKPTLASQQSLESFFRDPDYPNAEDYQIYRRFLLETSQVLGGFYSRKGRAALLRGVLPWVLQDESPYDKMMERVNARHRLADAEKRRADIKLVKSA